MKERYPPSPLSEAQAGKININAVESLETPSPSTVERGYISDECHGDQEIIICAQNDIGYNARGWSTGKKISISLGAIGSFFVITLATSIYIASIPGIMAEFEIGQTLAIAPVTFYAMGFVIGPLISSTLSEEFGRQYIFKCSLILHLVFTIIGGSAQSFRTVAVARALSGIVGSPSVAVFAGVLNDMWKMPEDKLAVPLFILYGVGGVAAPEIGPIIGESIVAAGGWRWSFWLTAVLVGICLSAMLLVPETYEPEIRRSALKLPRRDWRKATRQALARPLHMLFMEPIMFPTAAIVTIGQVVIFIFYASFPLVLKDVYQFSQYQVGLAFLPLLAGSILAVPVLAFVDRRNRARLDVTPERILPSALLAGVLMPISLLWLGWTVRTNIHWIWPLLAGIPYGLGFALTQLVYPLYKNEVYGSELGVSVLAVDVAMRYGISCVFPLFTVQLVDRIGFEWAISICAIALVPFATLPLALKKYGPSLRGKGGYVDRYLKNGYENATVEISRNAFEAEPKGRLDFVCA